MERQLRTIVRAGGPKLPKNIIFDIGSKGTLFTCKESKGAGFIEGLGNSETEDDILPLS
jgi:hypothetical protein